MITHRGQKKGKGLLTSLDLFQKTDKEVKVRSRAGGILTMVGAMIVFLLVCYEFYIYLSSDIVQTISVDTTRNGKITLDFDISFDELHCNEVTVEAMDQMGNVYEPLPYPGRSLRTVQKGGTEGCRIAGQLTVRKLQGIVQFIPGDIRGMEQHHINQMNPMHLNELLKRFNPSHLVHTFAFGPKLPNRVNPLEGYRMGADGIARQQYYLQLVPSKYVTSWSSTSSFQYSVTNHTQDLEVSFELATLPGVFMRYDISPMLVYMEERPHYLTHFLVKVCAVVGGVWVVMGLTFSTLRSIGEMLNKVD
eukprot:TRINITY_DN2249_c0_g1_i1.p1 TRINITY_DN2249_c0_g1~~TRINITY_DN2249_c0_g1_i1.p1  ORF type:complete len:305 (-),score=53.14 TRINITY_DN2249_c0_g1_i1:44-958(-)